MTKGERMNQHLIDRLAEEWAQLDPVDPLRGLIADAIAEINKQSAQEPVAWMPIEQMYPQAKAIDILMGDGSILCAVLPQFDGDLWWEGSGTGEKFIDPKYANVTHWRIHGETHPQAREPLSPEQTKLLWHKARICAGSNRWTVFKKLIEAAHGIKENT